MNEEFQQSAAESAETLPDAVEKTVEAGEAGAPEIVETDEQKNQRIQAESAEANRKREEKRQTSIQRRMDELTADKYAERKRADQLQALVERLTGDKQPKAETPADGAPKREDFESYEDFVRADARHHARIEAAAATAAALEKHSKAQEESKTTAARETEQQKVEKQFLERRAAAEKELPDYREVIEDWEPKLPDSVVDLIVRLEDGPLITYHMAKNPALEAQFRDSPAHMHGILLGQLLATLKGSTKESAAPKPGKPVTGKVAASDGSGYSGDPEGYYAWAQKNLR